MQVFRNSCRPETGGANFRKGFHSVSSVHFVVKMIRPCPCGSGKKYKKCCAAKGETVPSGLKAAIRMKGGISFDQVVNAYRAIVHSWDWQPLLCFNNQRDIAIFYLCESENRKMFVLLLK